MIEVSDVRNGEIFLNIDRIQHIEKERYGGMTYVVMDDGRAFKVLESYEDVKSKIKRVRNEYECN